MSEQQKIETLDLEPKLPVHETLFSAVVAVMAEVKRLEKDQENAFAKYMFTSIDDYKDELRPIMAKHGVSMCVSQIGFETFVTKSGTKETLNCVYRFKLWLEHVSGAQNGKEGLIVPLPYTGAQTAGIARSYAVKEYLKSRFLQSSGDTAEDADSYAMDVKLTREKARPYYEGICAELDTISKTGTRDDLLLWSEKHKVIVDAFPDDWKVYLKSEFHQAQIGIKMRTDSSIASEELPEIAKWKEDFETEILAANDADSVNEVWLQNEDTVETLVATDKAWAMRVYDERMESLS